MRRASARARGPPHDGAVRARDAMPSGARRGRRAARSSVRSRRRSCTIASRPTPGRARTAPARRPRRRWRPRGGRSGGVRWDRAARPPRPARHGDGQRRGCWWARSSRAGRRPVRRRELLQRADGVVGPDDADDARRARVQAGVGPALLGLEAALLGGRVVARLVADAEAARAEVVPAQDERDRVRDRPDVAGAAAGRTRSGDRACPRPR